MDFVPIDEFPTYGVNHLGQVMNLVTGRVLGNHRSRNGHIYVSLSSNYSLRHVRSVGRLVAEAFLPEPYFESHDTIIHLDYDLENNGVDNLMWRDRSFAIKYQSQNRLPYYPSVTHPIRLVETNEIFPNSDLLCRTYGLLDLDVDIALDKNMTVYPYDIHIVSDF